MPPGRVTVPVFCLREPRKCSAVPVTVGVEADFGYTFVAQDPDGHRLRVFTVNP